MGLVTQFSSLKITVDGETKGEKGAHLFQRRTAHLLDPISPATTSVPQMRATRAVAAAKSPARKMFFKPINLYYLSMSNDSGSDEENESDLDEEDTCG